MDSSGARLTVKALREAVGRPASHRRHRRRVEGETLVPCEEATAKALRERGYRMTPQRTLIVAALRHLGGHRTAQELRDAVHRAAPVIDASTVYRTLATLKDLRLVTETDLGRGESAFEWRDPEPHHHLVCERCGSATWLDHRYLAQLRHTLQDDLGFEANIDHFAIFGTCQQCRGTAV